MFATRWFRPLWSASRSSPRGGNEKKPRRQPEVRPLLETLEDRVCPSTFPTVTSISAGAASFSLFGQTETVTTQTNLATTNGGLNGTLPQQQTITINDGGQSQTVNIGSNGQATATFHFTLLQELQNLTFGSHSISANYPGFPVGTPDATQTFGASSANGTAPGNTIGYLFQISIDLAIARAFGF